MATVAPEKPRSRAWEHRDIIALALIGVALTLVIIENNRISRTKASISALQAQALGECHRVQVLREHVNDNSEAIYNLLAQSVAAGEVVSLAQTNRRLKAIVRRFYATARRELSGITYLPPTDCGEAIRHPFVYRPPAPIPWVALRRLH